MKCGIRFNVNPLYTLFPESCPEFHSTDLNKLSIRLEQNHPVNFLETFLRKKYIGAFWEHPDTIPRAGFIPIDISDY